MILLSFQLTVYDFLSLHIFLLNFELTPTVGKLQSYDSFPAPLLCYLSLSHSDILISLPSSIFKRWLNKINSYRCLYFQELTFYLVYEWLKICSVFHPALLFSGAFPPFSPLTFLFSPTYFFIILTHCLPYPAFLSSGEETTLDKAG